MSINLGLGRCVFGKSIPALALLAMALLPGLQGRASGADAIMAEVVWGMSPEAMPKRLSDLAPGDLVLDRKDGKLYKFDGKAMAETAPAPKQVLVNRATRNFLAYQDADKGWTVVPNAGELNVRDFGARGDYVPGAPDAVASDDTAPLQAAIDQAGTFGHHAIGRTVYVPGGRYRVSKTLNVTTDMKTNNHCNLFIRGDGANSTYFHGDTGGILFDFTGSMWNRLEDFSIVSHFGATPSTVGLYIARGQENQWAIRYRISRVHIHLLSDPKANNGIGTIGIWNFGGEHHTYNDISIEANLPLALVLWRDKPEGLPAFLESSIVKVQETNAVSQHFTTVGGTSILVALDFVRPCIYVNRAAEVRLDNTYLSLRRNPYSPQTTTPGNFFYAVELYAVYQFYHHGMLEGTVVTQAGEKRPGYGYLKSPIYLDGADVKVGLGYMLSDERDTPKGDKRGVPPIDLTPVMDFASGIFNSSIDIRYQPNGPMALPESAIVADENQWSQHVTVQNSRVQTTTPSRLPANILPQGLRRRAVSTVLYDYVSDEEHTTGKAAESLKTPLF